MRYVLIGAAIGVVLASAGLPADADRGLHDWCADSSNWCIAVFGVAGAAAGWASHRFGALRHRGAKWNLLRWLLSCTVAGVLIGLADLIIAGSRDNFALSVFLGLVVGASIWATQEYLSPSVSADRSENKDR